MANLVQLCSIHHKFSHLTVEQKFEYILKHHPKPDAFFARALNGCYHQEGITGDYRNTQTIYNLQRVSETLTPLVHRRGKIRHVLEIKNIVGVILSYLSLRNRLRTERTNHVFMEASHESEANTHCCVGNQIVENLHSMCRLERCKDLNIWFLQNAKSEKAQQLKKCKNIRKLSVGDATYRETPTTTANYINLIEEILISNAPHLVELRINNTGVAMAFFSLLLQHPFPKLDTVHFEDCYSGHSFYDLNTSRKQMEVSIVQSQLPSLGVLKIENLEAWNGGDKGIFVWQAINTGRLLTISFGAKSKEFEAITQLINDDDETAAVDQMDYIECSINKCCTKESITNIATMFMTPVGFPLIFVSKSIHFKTSDLNHISDILLLWVKKFKGNHYKNHGFKSLQKLNIFGFCQFLNINKGINLLQSLIDIFKLNNALKFDAQFSFILSKDYKNQKTNELIVLLATLGKNLANRCDKASIKINCEVQHCYFGKHGRLVAKLQDEFRVLGYDIVIPSYKSEVLYKTATYSGKFWSSSLKLNHFAHQIVLDIL